MKTPEMDGGSVKEKNGKERVLPRYKFSTESLLGVSF